MSSQFFEFKWISSYVVWSNLVYIYVDVFCTHLFLHTVISKAAGDLALNFFFTVSVKCLPSQVCFNFLSELANGRSKIENSTISKWVCTRVCTRRRSSRLRSSSVNSRIQRWANVLLHCTAWRSTMDEKFRFQSDTYKSFYNMIRWKLFG